jgi:proteic killer suppression protein
MSSVVVKTSVLVSKSAEKQLRKIPSHIKESLRNWVATVERIGIREARKLSGFHDEPLHGDRKGQRSVRLNKAYRAIYIETIQGLQLLVIEVNKHEY